MPFMEEVDPISLTIKSHGRVKINHHFSKGGLNASLHTDLCEDEIKISLLHPGWYGSVGWKAVPYTKRSQVRFPVRVHAWVVGLSPHQGLRRPMDVLLFLPAPLKLIKACPWVWIKKSLLLIRFSPKGSYHSYLSFAIGEKTPSLSPGPFPLF